MNIKKSFQLNQEDPTTQSLMDLSEVMQIGLILLNEAKRDFTEAMVTRNRILKQVLLEQYGYIIAVGDKVCYMDQTNEIRVYSEKDYFEDEEIFKQE